MFAEVGLRKTTATAVGGFGGRGDGIAQLRKSLCTHTGWGAQASGERGCGAGSHACSGSNRARLLPPRRDCWVLQNTLLVRDGKQKWVFSTIIKSNLLIFFFFCDVAFIVRSDTLLFCLLNNVIYQPVHFFYINATHSYKFALIFILIRRS